MAKETPSMIRLVDGVEVFGVVVGSSPDVVRVRDPMIITPLGGGYGLLSRMNPYTLDELTVFNSTSVACVNSMSPAAERYYGMALEYARVVSDPDFAAKLDQIAHNFSEALREVKEAAAESEELDDLGSFRPEGKPN